MEKNWLQALVILAVVIGSHALIVRHIHDVRQDNRDLRGRIVLIQERLNDDYQRMMTMEWHRQSDSSDLCRSDSQ